MNAALFAALLLAAGHPFNDVFDRATSAYNRGDFAGAIQGYEQLVAERVNDPAVFYNLGNAYYRTGRLGVAIANYERALRLDPHFEDAQQNLDHCLDKTKRRLARPLPPDWEQSLLFWHYGIGEGTTRALAILSWSAFWAILGLRRWRNVRYLGVTAALIGVAAAGLGASAWAKAHPEELAVAMAETVPVFYTTSDSGTVRFELYEGDRVQVVDRRGDEWLRVRTIDGEQGWASRKQMMAVGPPYLPPPPMQSESKPVSAEEIAP
ncbi:MAG TPA: tetratricopeptide repeat protein [Candidatus Hydrogenedentes bacterium]|nr:tetratricopeptide repeat protein [Candidatus Hydrogenedentota bacterium]HOS02380.1 tetratricopeptide repeat protein [Candidatus Hydrogenedentota bacterium]